MKRLISTVLALSLLGTTVAAAQPFRGGQNYGPGIQRETRTTDWSQTRNDRGNYGVRHDYRGGNWNRGHNDNNALLGLGVGLFALLAIAASQHNADHYRNNDGYYYGR